MASMPAMNTSTRRLAEIPGMVPAPQDLGRGCAYAARCAHASARCRAETPTLEAHSGGHVVACFHVDRVEPVFTGAVA
jgi:peptide/nickel transport system ATP-binding protein